MCQKKIFFLVSCLIIFYACNRNTIHEKKMQQFLCINDIWYEISKTPNPDKIFCTVDISDSSLFYFFILNQERLKFNYHGSIYDIDTFHIHSQSLGAHNNENSLIIGQTTSPLNFYSKELLDSLFQKVRERFKIEIVDTLTNQHWEFKTCMKSTNIKEKPWFKNIPKWLFLIDSI
jgi:hypothetical protein